jgi:hypothetical protein
MYQGKILKDIYQINAGTFKLHYEDKTEDVISFNSFNINVDKRKYSQNKMFFNMENRLPIEIPKKIFFSHSLENLSLNKMNYHYILNNKGFKITVYKYTLQNEEDYFGLSFNMKSSQQEFKIILAFSKYNVKFIPIIFVNKSINIHNVQNSKFYICLKSYFGLKNIKNNDFSNMICSSDYLHQNSAYYFNLTE